MTRRLPFYFVDVFATRPLTGNPLSLVPYADELDEDLMRAAPGTTRSVPGSYARFFNPTVGIAEDPATGTAAGPLAARLVAEGWIAGESTVIIEQGYALGRPSRIAVSVSGQRVRVGGSGVVAAEGSLIVSPASVRPAQAATVPPAGPG
jgi:predicted PhzF superfamily epimerase YddE/YHI9